MTAEDSSPLIRQRLGNTEYALRASPIRPWYKSIVGVVSLPVMVPMGVIISVLMLSKSIQHRYLAWFLPLGMDKVAQEFKTERQTLLGNVRGRVMDVGSGGGAYLDHCHAADHVVAVEPVVELHPTIRKRGKELASLTLVQTVDEVVQQEPPESLDWVILGNVLCEVDSVPETLQQINTLLKPGGHVYFSEHLGHPVGSWSRSMQDWCNPFWRHMSGGCNCNRDSLAALESLGWPVVAWYYNQWTTTLFGPFVLGLAQKPPKAV